MGNTERSRAGETWQATEAELRAGTQDTTAEAGRGIEQ